MNSDPTQVIDLSNVQNPFTLVFLGLIIGAIVRILRAKPVNDWLESTKPAWIKQIPKKYLPWIANGLGVVIAYADLTLNAHMNWKSAIAPALMGVFSGSLAVSGHETVAKAVGAALYKPKGPIDPQGPLGPNDPTIDPADQQTAEKDNAMRSRALLKFGVVLVAFAFSFASVSGCAAALAMLPDVIAYIMDGMQVLDAVAAFAQRYFAQHPNPVAQARVADALEKARNALNVALRSAQGAKEMDNAQVDAAFEDFKKAYLDLISLVRSLGLNVSTRHDGAMRAVVAPNGDEALEVPEPLVFKKAVKR